MGRIEIFKHSCSLNCFDLCKFKVVKRNGKIDSITGSSRNKFTKGIICNKGRSLKDIIDHKDRLYKPLLKTNDGWKEIEYREAITYIKEKLEKYKPEERAYYEEYGAGGVLKGIAKIFFNHLGGVITNNGGSCWAAGDRGTKYDFGSHLTSDIDEVFNSKTIILWGRNPKNTSIHLYERVLRAKKEGINLITIDPRKNETSTISDTHLQIEPSTDGALAMAMTKMIIDEGKIGGEYIERYILGFKEYRNYLETLSLEFLINETKIPKKEVEKLKDLIVQGKVSCFLGYGMQRYSNGGNTIRAIDALMAISKNIGEKGSGVFYSNKVSGNLDSDPTKSYTYSKIDEKFDLHNFADYIEKSKLKTIFFSRCNPLGRYANLNKFEKAFKKIEFKVCFDLFMTETAAQSDLIIPTTNTLESEDIISSGMMSPYLEYNEKVMEPREKLMDEYFFYQELAKEMNLVNFPQVGKKEYLNQILDSVSLSIQELKKGGKDLTKNKTAWEEMIFDTQSGLIEIYSEKAKEDGHSPYPVYSSPLKGGKDYPIRLITPHHRNHLMGQGMLENKKTSELYLNKKIIEKYSLKEGEKVRVSSKEGEIEVVVLEDDTLRDNIGYIYAIWGNKNGNPNYLTSNLSSDIGGQVAYYDTFINLIQGGSYGKDTV